VTDMGNIVAELAELKKLEEESEKNNILKRTLSKLLSIEKKATYGTVSGGKVKLLEREIMAELDNYRDDKNAS